MRKKIMVSLCLFPLFFFYGFIAMAADESSCIKCHTNDVLMKSLHKPLPIKAGGGEG